MSSGISDPIISEIQYCEECVRDDVHQHNEYEIIYVLEGEVDITINNVTHHVCDQTLVFLTNLENHSVRQITQVYRRYFVTLHTVPTDAFIRNPDILSVLKNHTSLPNCIDVSGISPTITGIFEKLLAYDCSEPFANELASIYITELLIHVLRMIPRQADSVSSACKQRILNVQTYLDIHYRENIRIDTLSKQFYISQYHLSHQFKELTGYSPKQYLTMVRLKNAAVMLTATKASLIEVAAACGFSDINNFIKQFRRIYGCTPSSFRPKNKSISQHSRRSRTL